jgi:rare lipoprotein A
VKRVFKYIVLISALVLIWSCGSSPRFTSKDTPPKVKAAEKPVRDSKLRLEDQTNFNEFHNVTVLETQTGIASYYADEFHGNPTSNGEIYDMYGISAAHPTYPEGTVVRVTNLSNNLSEILRINDRMPVHPDRIIDLSYGAAEKLDMISDGLAEVKIEVLKWGDGKYKK